MSIVPLTFIEGLEDGDVVIVMNGQNRRLLATMIANEVIGDPIDIGIVAGINQGLGYSDEYWGTHLTMEQALGFARDLLKGLGTDAETEGALKDADEFLNMAQKAKEADNDPAGS